MQGWFHSTASRFRWNASSLVGSQHEVAIARAVVTSGCVNASTVATPVMVQALVYILALVSISGNKNGNSSAEISMARKSFSRKRQLKFPCKISSTILFSSWKRSIRKKLEWNLIFKFSSRLYNLILEIKRRIKLFIVLSFF